MENLGDCDGMLDDKGIIQRFQESNSHQCAIRRGEGVGPTAVTNSDVVGVWEARIRAVGNHAVCELELVGMTSAVGFAIVVFLFSAEIDVEASVVESVILESVGLLERLV